MSKIIVVGSETGDGLSEEMKASLKEIYDTYLLNSVLFRALTTGDCDIVRHVINGGAHVNAQDVMDDTPLHYAMKFQKNIQPDIVQFLIDRGADVHARNAHNQTPFTLFCRHLETVGAKEECLARLLLNAGAQPTGLDVVPDVERRMQLMHIIQNFDQCAFQCPVRLAVGKKRVPSPQKERLGRTEA